MEKILKNQIEFVESAQKWIVEALNGERQKNAYRYLADCHRKLSKKKYSLEGNPAAALYGESQAGKSYLVSSLLSDNGNFMVVDGHDNKYNFKDEINPKGDERESTSVVTRFSTREKFIDKDFPVICRLLSPTDLIIVMCEAYYNNVKSDKALSYEDLKSKTSEIVEKYKNSTEIQNYIDIYDILDIKEYFIQNFSNLSYQNINDIKFFDVISEVISKIGYNDWKVVFSLLWNCNQQITKLFGDLIEEYHKINFSETIYVPIDAILRSHGTILDVQCLENIYGKSSLSNLSKYQKSTEILYSIGDDAITGSMDKAFVCALTSELVISLPESLKKTKPFLNKTDLLDFPGARRNESVGDYENPNKSISDGSLMQLLRRGKVDYLFNKYSMSEKINVLLLCQNHKDSKQSIIPARLNKWISNMVGDTAEARDDFKCSVPPLFIVSTWFNCDLQYDTHSDSEDGMKQKWEARFVTVLEKQIVRSYDYKWFNNWTKKSPFFKNIYMLRDYEKSSEMDTTGACRVFKGYKENGKETEANHPDYLSKLKGSFVKCEFVKNHFADPSYFWDESATVNKDGSVLIIDNLTKAADEINNARYEKNKRDLNELNKNILSELHKYYHDSDSDALLDKAKSAAGRIQLCLDCFFGRDPFFFGKMIETLLISKGIVYQLFKDVIMDLKKRNNVNSDKYVAIRLAVPELNASETYNHNLNILCNHYELKSESETEKYFESIGVDLKELFFENKEMSKDLSQILADKVIEYWLEQHVNRRAEQLSKYFGENGLQDILDMFRSLMAKREIANKIAIKIRQFVIGDTVKDDVISMISDMSAEILNNFINTIGFNCMTADELASLEEANENNNLNITFEHCSATNQTNTNNDMAELLENYDNRVMLQNRDPIPQSVKMLPNYRNYKVWVDNLKIGFVSVCEIPNYDVDRNIELKAIIDNLKNINYN